jgi:AcrR family transcriptional regulator
MTSKPQRKRKGAYHHGDLERALVEAALRTIRLEGVQGLTLRGVGAQLGVSRTALYRHFEDKAALVARVALEGFTLFHEALSAAIPGRTGKRATLSRRWLAPMFVSRWRTSRTTRPCSAVS